MTRMLTRAMALFAIIGLTACDDGDSEPNGNADATVQGAGGEGGGAGGEGGGAGGEGGAAGEGGGVEAALQSLEIQGGELTAGGEHQFAVIGTFDDGSTRDLSAEVEWASDNVDIVAFSEGGMADLPWGGPVTVTATLGEISAEWSTTVGCDYPRFPANIRMGQTVAPVKWSSAFNAAGEDVGFDLRTASCYAEYKDVNAFILIINAAWCAPCIQEIRRVGPQAQALLDAGGLILYIVLQDTDYSPMDGIGAHRHINRLVGDDSPGMHMGAIGAEPEQFFNNPAIIEAFPTSFVVRKSDMQVIADSRGANYHIDPWFPAMLADLEADWSDPQATAPLPFNSHCEEGDEEASEPNDEPGMAAPLAVGTATGGICTAAPDFYAISEEGAWQLTVEFDGTVGDIDIGLWDLATNNIARVNGQPVSSAGTGNTEQISGTGPGVVIVYGYGGASAPYSITLAAE